MTSEPGVRPLVPDRKQRLEVRRVFLAVHHRRFDILEPGLAQKSRALHFREAQPQIGVHFARFFVVVPQQIQHHDPAAGFQDPPRLRHRALGMLRVMQSLAEERQIHGRIPHRHASRSPLRYSRFLTPCLRASSRPYSTIFSELSTAITFFARRASNCENVPSPAPRSAITIGGISVSSVSARPLPGPARHVVAARTCPPAHRSRRASCPAAARSASRRASESCSASGISRRRLPENVQQLLETLRLASRARLQPVQDALAVAPVLHQPGLLQLRQMRRNAALAHAEDLLQFGHGKLFALYQQQDPEAAGIGQQPQVFED